MIIIPLSRSPDWRRPPLVTLLLVLVNFLIFYGLQSGDAKRDEKALAYYASSSLPQIELPRYVQQLESAGPHARAGQARQALAAGQWQPVLMLMENDAAFMRRLRAGLVVTAGEPGYATWRSQRERFDALAHAGMVDRFGFRPAEPTLAGFVGHMFLHGSFDHLLGNMAILFIVGYLVEETLGKRRFLAFYLLAGLGAAALDLVVNADRMIPGIGASGAISGVMAMFVALYGMRRIRFFYWVIFYFDFFRAPAIAILPLWIANELYQHLFAHGSPVNYIAHLGGFISGALLIAGQRKWGKAQLVAPEQEAAADPLPGELARIDALLADLRVDEAKRALARLAEARPQDRELAIRYYRLAKTDPAGDDYHRAAALIFALPEDAGGFGDDAELLHATFVEYLKLAKPSVCFSPALLVTLIRRLARAGHVDDADRLTKVLARRAPQHERLPDLLLLVAESCRRVGNAARQQELLAQLQNDFPGSATAEAAARMYR